MDLKERLQRQVDEADFIASNDLFPRGFPTCLNGEQLKMNDKYFYVFHYVRGMEGMELGIIKEEQIENYDIHPNDYNYKGNISPCIIPIIKNK